ncbi:hypothetical protein [Ichthyenterobacterium magnum]|uniref:DUF4878 domain-containing protein n=1 Tax=Ichthyenterobacterium magnum TaxID=1230530 RepID=A0A420DES5_9FLAO|nr:hypothetical protein [Ichthyenterobacterium magnum]RKE90905.1 hypothetical protein BXY80_2495 [Ichthyenterobacterium magnum]
MQFLNKKYTLIATLVLVASLISFSGFANTPTTSIIKTELVVSTFKNDKKAINYFDALKSNKAQPFNHFYSLSFKSALINYQKLKTKSYSILKVNFLTYKSKIELTVLGFSSFKKDNQSFSIR